VVLIREICNAIINAAVKFCSGKDILGMLEEEAQTAVEKLKCINTYCVNFKEKYYK